MKKTRFIIALVAAMFAVGAMLFVACEKDEESVNSQIAEVASKSTPKYFSKSIDAVFDLFKKCDEAYAMDSVAFLDACNASDMETFCTLTKTTKEQLELIGKTIAEERDEYLQDFPETEGSDTGCEDCMKSALPRLGSAVSMTSGNLSSVAVSIREPTAEDFVSAWFFCVEACSPLSWFPDKYAACVAACIAATVVAACILDD